MKARLQSVFTKVAICALFVTATATARAQSGGGCLGPCKGELVAIVVGIGAGGAALGVGIYYATHHNRSLTGCATATPDGLRLQTEGDHQTYALLGDTAAVKPGERVRVSGKRQKRGAVGTQSFLVEKVAKDFGVCKALPAAP
jgi:hypothetical protein